MSCLGLRKRDETERAKRTGLVPAVTSDALAFRFWVLKSVIPGDENISGGNLVVVSYWQHLSPTRLVTHYFATAGNPMKGGLRRMLPNGAAPQSRR